MFTFVRFLAWAFYWMRLELAALQQPERELVVSRTAATRGRWVISFGESVGQGREAWCAIRQLLEGRDEREPLEFSPEALAGAADELEDLHAKEREKLEAEAHALRDAARARDEERQRLAAALEAERERDELAGRERATSGATSAETPMERALRETREAEERAKAALVNKAAGVVAGAELEAAGGAADVELSEPERPRRGF